MNVVNALADVTDLFVIMWGFLDSIILLPDTNISFAKVIVVLVVILAVGSILFKLFGSSASGIGTRVVGSASRGGSKSDT